MALGAGPGTSLAASSCRVLAGSAFLYPSLVHVGVGGVVRVPVRAVRLLRPGGAHTARLGGPPCRGALAPTGQATSFSRLRVDPGVGLVVGVTVPAVGRRVPGPGPRLVPAPDVLPMGDRLQVVGSHTRGVPAEVVEVVPGRHRTHERLVGPPMGLHRHPALRVEGSVAQRVAGRGPDPARAEVWPVRREGAELVDLVPELIGERHRGPAQVALAVVVLAVRLPGPDVEVDAARLTGDCDAAVVVPILSGHRVPPTPGARPPAVPPARGPHLSCSPPNCTCYRLAGPRRDSTPVPAAPDPLVDLQLYGHLGDLSHRTTPGGLHREAHPMHTARTTNTARPRRVPLPLPLPLPVADGPQRRRP